MRIAYPQSPPPPPEQAPRQEEEEGLPQILPPVSSPSMSHGIKERMAKYSQIASPRSVDGMWWELSRGGEKASSSTATDVASMSLEERVKAFRNNSSRTASEREPQSKEEGAVVVKGGEAKNPGRKEWRWKRVYPHHPLAPNKPADVPAPLVSYPEEDILAEPAVDETEATADTAVKKAACSKRHPPPVRPADMPDLDPNLLKQRMETFSHCQSEPPRNVEEAHGPDANTTTDGELSSGNKSKLRPGAGQGNASLALVSITPSEDTGLLSEQVGVQISPRSLHFSVYDKSPPGQEAARVPAHAVAIDVEPADPTCQGRTTHLEAPNAAMVPSDSAAVEMKDMLEEILDDDRGLDDAAVVGNMEEGQLQGARRQSPITDARIEEGEVTVIGADTVSGDGRLEGDANNIVDTQRDAVERTGSLCSGTSSFESEGYSDFLAYLDSPGADREDPMPIVPAVSGQQMDLIHPATTFEPTQEQIMASEGKGTTCAMETMRTQLDHTPNEPILQGRYDPSMVEPKMSKVSPVKRTFYEQYQRPIIIGLVLVIAACLVGVTIDILKRFGS